MKIEFVKEEKSSGTTIYYTNVNGSYVNNSLSLFEDEGKKLFELIKKDHTALETKKTVLESIEIEDEKK